MISLNLAKLLMVSMAGGLVAAWLLETRAIERDERDDQSRWSGDSQSG